LVHQAKTRRGGRKAVMPSIEKRGWGEKREIDKTHDPVEIQKKNRRASIEKGSNIKTGNQINLQDRKGGTGEGFRDRK